MAVEQGNATFYCQHCSRDVIDWILNGKPVKMIDSPHISTNVQTVGSGKIYMLSIRTLPEFNETIVECVAIFHDINDGLPQFTPRVTLLIQGLVNICMYMQSMHVHAEYAYNNIITLILQQLYEH